MTTDAVVIGAGILGCSTAWQLAERGMSVTVVDREPEPGRGSTARSTAVIRQRYSHPAAIALAREGLHWWERWPELVPADADGQRAALRPCGVLFLLPAGEPSTPRLADTMRSLGVEVELLDRDALRAGFTSLRFADDEAVEGLLEPRGGYVDDPARAARDAARAAEQRGARFQLGTGVAEVVTDWNGGRLRVRGLRTVDGNSIDTPVVVNCAGPHSGWMNLVARSPLALTTAPLRQVVVDGTAPAMADLLGRLPVIADLLSGFYMRPDPACLRIGALLPRDETEFLADADAVPEAEPQAVAARLQAARRRLPQLALERCRGLVGVYDVTVQDWYPIVDRTDTEGYFVAIGTSGAWFKAGPVIGHLTAELVTAALQGHDTDREPLEVALPFTGHRFPMSAFSRRRAAVPLQYGGGVLG